MNSLKLVGEFPDDITNGALRLGSELCFGYLLEIDASYLAFF